MEPVPVMINGNPGNVSSTISRHIMGDPRFHLLPFSLTGEDVVLEKFMLDTYAIHLIPPSKREEIIPRLKKEYAPFISVDYTHPASVNSNAAFYTAHELPFVMGTTGGDREMLMQTVQQSSISAVISPNMAKQIVAFQAMMEYASNTFPDLFKGFRLKIIESHQKGKADTSGTAKAMVTYFNKMGIPFGEEDIIKIRDPHEQKEMLKVPEEHIGGHGWHTYTLTSEDHTAAFQFTHNINGREIYARGTTDAILFLDSKMREGKKGMVYSMIDVLKKTF